MAMVKTFLIIVCCGVMLSTLPPAAYGYKLYWTQWVSEEGGGPPSACTFWNEAAVGFGCSGKYCDNVQLLCETLPFNITLDSSTDYWTNYFSEEHDAFVEWTSWGWYPYADENFQVCHSNTSAPGLVSGIKCRGSYCDQISIECTQPAKYVNGRRYAVAVQGCTWTAWQSEEQGSKDFGWNRYITGVKCRGSYCDDKSFYVCSLVDPAP
jgi:hypothetical protein